ncbi:MAG: hypothetical protein HGA65_00895 [Oscillochloris sp.]|nr:hypothetical protein [Oscillochloris sp.]
MAHSELILDMGSNNPIIDGEGGDLYVYERPSGEGILLDLMTISVAPDNGAGQPGEFTTIFVWGDDDPSNNGTIPPWYEENAEERITGIDLHDQTGIGLDIGKGDGLSYRFIRIQSYPAAHTPGRGLGAEIDAIEIANFTMPEWNMSATDQLARQACLTLDIARDRIRPEQMG